MSTQSLYGSRGIAIRSRARPLWIDSLHAIWCWASAPVRRELEKRRATAELHSLSDHMLRDIGISRGEIEHVVREGRAARPHRIADPACVRWSAW